MRDFGDFETQLRVATTPALKEPLHLHVGGQHTFAVEIDDVYPALHFAASGDIQAVAGEPTDELAQDQDSRLVHVREAHVAVKDAAGRDHEVVVHIGRRQRRQDRLRECSGIILVEDELAPSHVRLRRGCGSGRRARQRAGLLTSGGVDLGHRGTLVGGGTGGRARAADGADGLQERFTVLLHLVALRRFHFFVFAAAGHFHAAGQNGRFLAVANTGVQLGAFVERGGLLDLDDCGLFRSGLAFHGAGDFPCAVQVARVDLAEHVGALVDDHGAGGEDAADERAPDQDALVAGQVDVAAMDGGLPYQRAQEMLAVIQREERTAIGGVLDGERGGACSGNRCGHDVLRSIVGRGLGISLDYLHSQAVCTENYLTEY